MFLMSRWVQLGVQPGGLRVSILRPVGPMFGSCSPDPPRALQESPKSPQTPQLGAKMARTWRQDGLQDLQLGAKMGVKSVSLEPRCLLVAKMAPRALTWSQDYLKSPDLEARWPPRPRTWSQDGPQEPNLGPTWHPRPPTMSCPIVKNQCSETRGARAFAFDSQLVSAYI